MSMYQLPELNLKQLQSPANKPQNFNLITAAIILVVGIFLGLIFGYYFIRAWGMN